MSDEPTSGVEAGQTIYWVGNEDQQFAERMKACRARRKKYGQSSCDEKDGSCDECEDDMARALRVTKAEFEAHARSSHD